MKNNMYVALNTAGSDCTVLLGVYKTEKDAQDALWKYFTLQKNSDHFLDSIKSNFFEKFGKELTNDQLRDCLVGNFDFSGEELKIQWADFYGSSSMTDFVCLNVEWVEIGKVFELHSYTWSKRYDLLKHLYDVICSILKGEECLLSIDYIAQEQPLTLPTCVSL